MGNKPHVRAPKAARPQNVQHANHHQRNGLDNDLAPILPIPVVQTAFRTQPRERVRVLVPATPLAAYIERMTVLASPPSPLSQDRLQERWVSIRRAVAATGRHIGITPDTLIPLSSDTEPWQRQFLDLCGLNGVFGDIPRHICSVRFDDLIISQSDLVLDHVARYRRTLGDAPPTRTMFDVCLPKTFTPAPTTKTDQGPFACTIDTVGDKLVPLRQMTLIGDQIPAQVLAFMPGANVSAAVVTFVGSPLNCFSAVEYNGRLLLLNGTHRAYALRMMGHTHAPCLVLRPRNLRELVTLFTDQHDVIRNNMFVDGAPALTFADYFRDEWCEKINMPPQTCRAIVNTQAFGQIIRGAVPPPGINN